jgi:hypothetical protein
LAGNGSITNDTAATNRVTIQNGVRYSVRREGLKGKLQTVQFQYEPVRARQFARSSRGNEFRRFQEPQTRLSFVCCQVIKRIIKSSYQINNSLITVALLEEHVTIYIQSFMKTGSDNPVRFRLLPRQSERL